MGFLLLVISVLCFRGVWKCDVSETRCGCDAVGGEGKMWIRCDVVWANVDVQCGYGDMPAYVDVTRGAMSVEGGCYV
jgi:hypothetical protein